MAAPCTFAGMKRSFADILQDLDGERARKLARKLPEWAAAGAEIPSALSLEQCSSSATARYKSCLASRSGQLPPETSFGPHRCASLAVPPLTMPRVARFPGAVAASGEGAFAAATPAKPWPPVAS